MDPLALASHASVTVLTGTHGTASVGRLLGLIHLSSGGSWLLV